MQTQGTSVDQIISSVTNSPDIQAFINNINQELKLDLLKINNSTITIDSKALKTLLTNVVMGLIKNAVPEAFNNPFVAPILTIVIDQAIAAQLDQISALANRTSVPIDQLTR